MAAGRLFYVMGASGCGKDSVMAHARTSCQGRGVAFAHRYITRPADAGGENHVALTPEEFQTRLAHGCFVLHWESHGLRYGVGREIDGWMASGLDVVVNGSRAYLPRAARLYEQLVPVLVTVAPDVLRQRLEGRGRESSLEIERRLERAAALADCEHPRLVRIDNSGPLADAGEGLVALLRDSLSQGTFPFSVSLSA